MQITTSLFSKALEQGQPAVCPSQVLHHYHPRIRALVVIPTAIANDTAGLIVIATEREQENIALHDLSTFCQLAQQTLGSKNTLATRNAASAQDAAVHEKSYPLEDHPKNDASSAVADGASEAKIAFSQPIQETTHIQASSTAAPSPQLTQTTIRHTHTASEPESGSRRMPRWVLLSLLIFDLLLVVPLLRQQPPLPPAVPSGEPTARNIPQALDRRGLMPNTPRSRVPQEKAVPFLSTAGTPGPHWLRIKASNDVWLSVNIDQTETKETFLRADDQVQWLADDFFVIGTEAPEHIQLIFNGKALAPLAPAEQGPFKLRLPPLARDRQKAD